MSLGSDKTDDNDGMWLELRDGADREVMFAYWSAINTSFTCTVQETVMPFAVVEDFLQYARHALPSSTPSSVDASQGVRRTVPRHDYRDYHTITGSDVSEGNDGMFSELTDDTYHIVMRAFWSDVDGSFTVTSENAELPFVVVEDFITEARLRLPPIHNAEQNQQEDGGEVGVDDEGLTG